MHLVQVPPGCFRTTFRGFLGTEPRADPQLAVRILSSLGTPTQEELETRWGDGFSVIGEERYFIIVER